MDSPLHILLFPFMSKGHTIPILHLARLLTIHRGAKVTIITTPNNRPFISTFLSDTNTSVLDIPFPNNIDGVPHGIESTDQLSDISLWLPLAVGTKHMQPHFEEALKTLHPPISFMVTDWFLYWTMDSATKFGIPRFVYFGMSSFAHTVSVLVDRTGLFREVQCNESIPVPDFPRLVVKKTDLDPVFSDPQPERLHIEFIINTGVAASKSSGMLVNSFYELEQDFLEYWNCHLQPKAWAIGPLCLFKPASIRREDYEKPHWIRWLDKKQEQGKTVMYVAFGSQAEISDEQFREIKDGLEKSEVNFLWVVRKKEYEKGRDGFEERMAVEDRGLVVKEWVEQREILEHPCIQGFLSHCGWNSVIESICAKVPILAWPMMAEQPLNAKMVAEELRIGMRVETSDDGFVKSEYLRKSIKELMEGEMGKEVRKKTKEVGESAIRAVKEGGSSWNPLSKLLNEFHANKDNRKNQ